MIACRRGEGGLVRPYVTGSGYNFCYDFIIIGALRSLMRTLTRSRGDGGGGSEEPVVILLGLAPAGVGGARCVCDVDGDGRCDELDAMSVVDEPLVARRRRRSRRASACSSTETLLMRIFAARIVPDVAP